VRRKLWIASAALLALIAIGGVAFWYLMNQPLYEPGMVRAGHNLRSPLAPPAPSDEPGFWNVEKDIRLHHFAAGNGRTVLVVHGGPGQPAAEPWPGLQALTGRYRFVYYDQRGCGQSSRPIDRFSSSNDFDNMKTLDRTLGLGAQIADIERIRAILGQEQLILVGHSFGGFLASLYAAEFPQRVKALILVAPADVLVMPQRGVQFFDEIGRRLPPQMKGEYAEYLKRYLDFGGIFSKSEAELRLLNAEFGKYYFAAAGNKAGSMPTLTDGSAGGGWMVQAMYVSMGRRHDYRAALGNVKAPALVIHGEDDMQPEAASRAYVDALPNAKLQVLRAAGHFSFLDQPTAFSTAVDRFLADIP
jgi:proline iminopeptidase